MRIDKWVHMSYVLVVIFRDQRRLLSQKLTFEEKVNNTDIVVLFFRLSMTIVKLYRFPRKNTINNNLLFVKVVNCLKKSYFDKHMLGGEKRCQCETS